MQEGLINLIKSLFYYISPQINRAVKNKSYFYNCYGRRDQFIESGIEGFKRKPDDSKLSAAECKIGQLQMELELTKKKNELTAKLKRK